MWPIIHRIHCSYFFGLYLDVPRFFVLQFLKYIWQNMWNYSTDKFLNYHFVIPNLKVESPQGVFIAPFGVSPSASPHDLDPTKAVNPELRHSNCFVLIWSEPRNLMKPTWPHKSLLWYGKEWCAALCKGIHTVWSCTTHLNTYPAFKCEDC